MAAQIPAGERDKKSGHWLEVGHDCPPTQKITPFEVAIAQSLVRLIDSLAAAHSPSRLSVYPAASRTPCSRWLATPKRLCGPTPHAATRDVFFGSTRRRRRWSSVISRFLRTGRFIPPP